jgi:hypothetical protein
VITESFTIENLPPISAYTRINKVLPINGSQPTCSASLQLRLNPIVRYLKGEWIMSFERAFINESCNRLNQSMSKIKHCFSQLDEGHIWIKPNHAMNSIGIIVNHLCGNVRELVV